MHMRAKLYLPFCFHPRPVELDLLLFLCGEKKQRVFCGIKCQITKLMCLVFKLWKSFVGKTLYYYSVPISRLHRLYVWCIYIGT